jgi:Tyrosine phosphatase family
MQASALQYPAPTSVSPTSSQSAVDGLRRSQGTLLPFDDTVCPGRPGARLRSALYVCHQTLTFAELIASDPFRAETYARFSEPWGLCELVKGAIYRSAEPRPCHLPWLTRFGIKTLVCVKRTLPTPSTLEYARAYGIGVARIDLGPDGEIDARAVQRALDVISRPALWPVLLHCDGGRHRTGIVVAALHRSQGASLKEALEMYEHGAAPSARVSDGAAIANYFSYRERIEQPR